MTLDQNQFDLSPIQGSMDLSRNPGVISCRVDSTSAGLVPGQAVKMVDSAGGIPKVVECAADTDDVFGFVAYNFKKSALVAGDACEIAAMRDNVMYMTASAAIARNGKVMIVVSGQKVATATTGKTIVGRAIDKAVNANDLIRVLIDLPGTAAP